MGTVDGPGQGSVAPPPEPANGPTGVPGLPFVQEWAAATTEHFVVRAPLASYADRHLETVAVRAERSFGRVVEALDLADARPARFSLYLVEWLEDEHTSGLLLASGTRTVPERNEIWQVYSPESPGEALEPAIARLVALPATGTASPAVSTLVADGLGGYLAARDGEGLSLSEIDRSVLALIQEGRAVSIVGEPVWTTRRASERLAIATSFAHYLIRLGGLESVRRLFEEYRAGRGANAVQTVFARSLESLEEDWVRSLGRPRPTGLGLGAFVALAWPYLRPHLRREIEIVAYMLFGLAFTLAVPLTAAYLVDRVIAQRDLSDLTLVLAGLIVAFILNTVLTYRRARLAQYVSESIIRQLRLDIFTRLQELSHSFYAGTKSGDVIARMTTDMERIQTVVSETMTSGAFLLLSMIFSAILLLYLNWLLGIIVLLLAPLFVLISQALDRRARPASVIVQERLSDLVSSVSENIGAQPVVKAFGLQGRAVADFRARLDHHFASALHLGVLTAIFSCVTSMITALMPLIVLGLGAYLIIRGDFTIGGLLAFVSLMNQFMGPIGGLAELAREVQEGSGAIDRVAQLIQTRPSIVDAPGARQLSPPTHELRFENVSFSYTGERPTLSDVSLTIPVGSNVAFVGPTGAGKSSVVALLLRFYEPSEGRILFDDQDIQQVTLASLRATIGVVFQDTFVFDTTIHENIAYGRPGATTDEVVAAARAAELHDFVVSLPEGYDTVVGERGVRMSGGQRQRLAIARAIIRDPAVLILDEATSALDPRTENAIQQTLRRISADRTTISITHRLTSAQHCDRVFVLDRGHLVEQGTHEELMRQDGLYRRLFEEQTEGGPRSTAVGVDPAAIRVLAPLAGLTAESFERLIDRFAVEPRGAGETVVRQGESGDRLYFIASGEVEVSVRDERGNERRLNILREGDYFGEVAFLHDVPRTATVRTLSPSLFYTLGRHDLELVRDQAPQLQQALAETAAERLAETRQQTSQDST